MVTWRIQLFGPLAVLRDGEAVKLRIRHQAILLARLVAYGDESISRMETAELLWPDADYENSLAYLRRAIKELRDLGIGIETIDERLRLDRGNIESDLENLRRAGGTRKLALPLDAILEGLDHPIADEIRGIVRRDLATILRAPSAKPMTNSVSRAEDGTLLWIGGTLIRTRPEVALELLARESDDLLLNNSPEGLLSILLNVLAANPVISPDRLRVLTLASHMALILTRMGLAEKLGLEALAGARSSEDVASETLALSALASLARETRRWEEGIAYGRRAVETAEQVGDLARLSLARNNLAGSLWHALEFDEAVEHYLLARETAPQERVRLLASANLVYLWAVFGIELDPIPESFEASRFTRGYGGYAEGYVQFSTGFGHGDLPAATIGVEQMLEIAVVEDMERLLCVALDCAAFTFARFDLPDEAAAIVRVGGRLRLRLGHQRSPAEKLAVRRHVAPPFFGDRVAGIVAEWDIDDLNAMERGITTRLRMPRPF